MGRDNKTYECVFRDVSSVIRIPRGLSEQRAKSRGNRTGTGSLNKSAYNLIFPTHPFGLCANPDCPVSWLHC